MSALPTSVGQTNLVVGQKYLAVGQKYFGQSGLFLVGPGGLVGDNYRMFWAIKKYFTIEM